jgi:hypothetical protein
MSGHSCEDWRKNVKTGTADFRTFVLIYVGLERFAEFHISSFVLLNRVARFFLMQCTKTPLNMPT